MGYPGTVRAARLCIALLVAFAAGCAARQSPQRPAVVVLEVKGTAGKAWRERVADLARERDVELVPAEDYWVMAKRLDARALTRRNVARVASAIGAAAVVHGRVSGKKRRRVVTIYVREGESGRVVETHRVLVRRGKAVRRTEVSLARRLLASVAPMVERPIEVAEKPAARPEKPDAKPAKPAAKPARTASAPERAAKPAPTEKPPPVEYDREGQALDDEMPTVLKR